MRLIYWLPIFFYFLSTGFSALGQDTLRGRVTDAQGQPLSGASVRLSKGGETLTGAAGRFSLVLTKALPDSLFISHIGYAPAGMYVTGSAAPIRISLSPSGTEMEEVVVSTGFQRIPKERATGSFVQVDRELLERSPATNLLDRLDGVVSGLLTDRRENQPSLQIRGLYTLTPNMSQPLVIVDNFPFEGGLENLNPNDVESVTVLRDAAAASIWGARAGNGVIVVTTKTAKYQQKSRLSLTANTGISSRTDMSRLPWIPSADYIELEKFLFDQGVFNTALNNPMTPVSPVVEILDKVKKGMISSGEADALIQSFESADVREDFRRHVYQPEFRRQYAASMSGGGSMVKYQLSAGYDQNDEVRAGDDFRRVTARSVTTVQPTKSLQIRFTLGLTDITDQNNSQGGWGNNSYTSGSRDLYPYARLVNEDGSPATMYLKYRQSFLDTVGRGMPLLDWTYRPVDEITLNDNTTRSTAVLAGIHADYDLGKYGKAEVLYQYQRNHSQQERFRSKETYFTRDLINQYTQVSGRFPEYPVPNNGILDATASGLASHAVRAQYSYDRRFNGDHQLTALAGMEARESGSRSESQRTYGHDERLGASPVTYNVRYPRLTGGSLAIPYSASFSETLDRFVSQFANAAYTYKGRYTVSASARRDASNLFGVKTNDRARPFWSAGLAWNLARESWYPSGLFPRLGLRLTHGYSGNVNNGISALTTLVYSSGASNALTGIPTARIGNIVNPGLRWERVHTSNIGLDFGSRNNRLSGSVEYYRKASTDVLGSQSLDPTTGVSLLRTNSASMRGSGFDLSLNAALISRPALRWSATLNLSHTTYKVTEYLVETNNYSLVSNGNLITIPGYGPYDVVGFRWIGLDPETGDPLGWLNGKVSKNYDSITRYQPIEAQVNHGSALPKVFGNILQRFEWKSFSLSANLLFRLGYFVRRDRIHYGALVTSGTMHGDYLNRWQSPGDETRTDVPSFIYPNPNTRRDMFFTGSEASVIPGDHVRVGDIRLGYRKFFDKGPRIELFLLAHNLNLIAWKKAVLDVDPDFPSGIRSPRSYTLGLSANF